MRSSAVAVLLPAAALALAACGSSSSGPAAAPPASQAPAAASDAPSQAAPSSAPAEAAAGAALKISGFKYDPTPLTVSPGQVVSAKNLDSAEHTVTSDAKGLFVGDDIAQGKTVTFKAPTKPGTYTFHCEYHASMHGTLVVK